MDKETLKAKFDKNNNLLKSLLYTKTRISLNERREEFLKISYIPITKSIFR